MPHPDDQRLCRTVEPQRRRNGAVRPDPGRRARVRRERVLARGPAPAPLARLVQAPAGDAGQRTALAPALADGVAAAMKEWAMERGWRALHALVPAAHRVYGREARLVLQPDRRRQRAGRVQGQGADPGRAGRVLVPDRRHPCDVRGARLHRVGPVLAGVHPREAERRAALHPDRVRVLDRRGARHKIRCCARWTRSRSALRALRLLGDEDAARLHDDRARAGVLPDRRELLLRAPRPRHHRPHPVRRQAAQGPRARRPPTSARSPSACWPACSTPSRR